MGRRTPFPRARTVAWASQARIIRQGWASGRKEFFMTQQEPYASYVGIDVSKATLDAAVRPTGQRLNVPNQEKGVRELVASFGEPSPAPGEAGQDRPHRRPDPGQFRGGHQARASACPRGGSPPV